MSSIYLVYFEEKKCYTEKCSSRDLEKIQETGASFEWKYLDIKPDC